MNKDENYFEQYEVGDLVTIQDTSYLGMVINRRPSVYGDSELTWMYQIHFCGEREPDKRWLLEDALERV